MRRKLLPFVLAPVLASCSSIREIEKYAPPHLEHTTSQSTWEVYGTNIEYVSYDDLDAITLSPIPVPIPEDMRWFTVEKKVRRKDKLESLLQSGFAEHGYTPERVRTLTFKQLVDACLDVVGDAFEYELVDDKKSEFAQKHGLHLSLERYLEEGKGDCDKYASAFIEAFNLMRTHNPLFTNVQVFNSKVGGYNILHDWVSFVVLHPEKMQVAYVDPTQYDTRGEQRIKRGVYIPLADEELVARIYRQVDPERSLALYTTILEDAREKPWKTAFTLFAMGEVAHTLGDRELLNELHERINCQFDILGEDGRKSFARPYRIFLKCKADIERRKGLRAASRETKKELDRLNKASPTSVEP